MLPSSVTLSDKSRLAVLLAHFATIDEPRDVRRISHPLAESLLLVVCGTIAAWGEAHLGFLRRQLPYENGVPGGRWLTILMNRINPALFSAVFTTWVRDTWPGRPDFVAIDGKTSRRGQDRAAGEEAIHLVSPFATTSRLVLGQEAVPSKANELTAIPILLARLAELDGLRGALVSIDAIATAVPASIQSHVTHDKGHGRIEQRSVSVVREVDWLSGQRRFLGELRLPDAACIVRVQARIERGAKTHQETRYYISSASLDPERAGKAVCSHWAIENRLQWVLDVTFADDQSRL